VSDNHIGINLINNAVFADKYGATSVLLVDDNIIIGGNMDLVPAGS